MNQLGLVKILVDTQNYESLILKREPTTIKYYSTSTALV